MRCTHCNSATTPTHTRRRGRLYRYYVCLGAGRRGHDTCPVRRENSTAKDTDLEEVMSSKPSGRLNRWDELHPAEHARILGLLIERIDVAPDGISVTLHAAGVCSLVAELADQESPALAVSEPVLEAAEQ